MSFTVEKKQETYDFQIENLVKKLNIQEEYKMGHKFLRVVLVLAMILTGLTSFSLPRARVQAASPEDTLSAACKAYYDVLKAAVDEYGVANEGGNYDPEYSDPSEGLYYAFGVHYAELIDFNNDGVPELFYSVLTDGELFSNYYVYSYRTGKVELLFSGEARYYGTGYDFVDIASGKNDGKYLIHYHGHYSEGEKETYFTVDSDGGGFVLTCAVVWIEEIDGTFSNKTYYINDVSVSEQEYNDAPKEHGFIRKNPTTDSSIVDFMDRMRVNYSVVYTVLADLEAKSIPPISVLVNENKLSFDQPPIIENGRTLVPLRAIFEALGAIVEWEQTTQTVTAVKDDITISLRIGSNVLKRNGENIELDTPAQVVGNRTLVPVRAIAESFGAEVAWDQNSRIVTISTGVTSGA